MAGREKKRAATFSHSTAEPPQRGSVKVAACSPTEPRFFYDARGLVVLLLVAVFVVATRLWALGDKPFHHDESMFATYAYHLRHTADYDYEPVLHGPFLEDTSALLFLLFGDSDTTARLASAIAGVLLVCLIWQLRGRLGNLAALVAVLLAAASPTLLFFSRFNRNDVLFTLAALTLHNRHPLLAR